MTHLADAVAQLLRQQTMRIHYLPGLPATHYTVRAPSLLTQLGHAVASSTGGRGGRTIPGSRIPLDVDGLQLWTDIHTSVSAWAQALGVDRRPYVAQAHAQAASERRELEPAWMRSLRPWLGPVAWDQPIEVPEKPAEPAPAPRLQLPAPEHHLPLEDRGHLDPALPPIGRLLRVTAAAALGAGDRAQAAVRTMTRRCSCGRDIAPADCTTGCWVHRITGMLSAIVEDREIRGAMCPECSSTTAIEDRSPGQTGQLEYRFRVPAVVIRIAVLPDAGPDELWAYRMCRACGAEGWLDYTSETEPPEDAGPVDQPKPRVRSGAGPVTMRIIHDRPNILAEFEAMDAATRRQPTTDGFTVICRSCKATCPTCRGRDETCQACTGRVGEAAWGVPVEALLQSWEHHLAIKHTTETERSSA